MVVMNDRYAPFGEGPLEQTLGDSTRTRILRYLSEVEGPRRQSTFADAIDVSQPMISRAKQPLVECGLVAETDDGLLLKDDVRETVGDFKDLIEE